MTMNTGPITTGPSLRRHAGRGVLAIDAGSGQPVTEGLRLTLRRRRDGRRLAPAASGPSGIHHWPDLLPPWTDALPPAGLAELIVEDTLSRYLPVCLPWPPVPDTTDGRLTTLPLHSAPQRTAPTGSALIDALLTHDAGGPRPAAWARVVATDARGQMAEGMADAAGRLRLVIALPPPARRPPGDTAPVTRPPGTVVTLQVFHDPTLGALSAVPRADWLGQPPVRALARADSADPLGPLRLESGRIVVPRTDGLPPDHGSELRLAPL